MLCNTPDVSIKQEPAQALQMDGLVNYVANSYIYFII